MGRLAADVCAMVREVVDESVMWGKGLFVLVVGGDTVGAWVLLVIAIMG